MIRRIFDAIPRHIRFLTSIYLLGIAFFTVPRLVLLFQHWGEIRKIPTAVTLQALWMGFRFDTVISGYFLALPLLLFTLLAIFRLDSKAVRHSIVGLIVALYSLGFLLCGMDIPYFNYFNSRLTYSVLNWIDTPEMVGKMIFQDPTYYPYMLLFISFTLLFAYLAFKIAGRIWCGREASSARPMPAAYYLRLLLVTVLAAALLFIGIRGRLAAKSPIRWGTAFFSTYALPNQLGLNPVFTFLRSWIDARRPDNRRLALMNDREALAQVQAALAIPVDSSLASPIARRINPDRPPTPRNIVLVLMENMAAAKMGRFGHTPTLTPHLDSLAQDRSYWFTHFYSAGIHTYNGVYSTLFGFPALLGKHSMKTTESMQPFSGLARSLSRHGYRSIFFSTHDEQFDNMGGFLSYNGFQQIVSQKDYPADQVLTALGVPDHFMLQFSLPYLERLAQSDAPFLAVYLTASDHGPYVIPEGISFRPRSGDIKQQIVEYADWSIGQFLRAVSREPWYQNTIFLFLADHGTNIAPVYDMSLSYHHIPLIIHMPGGLEEAQQVDALGGQIDVYPTLMGLLNLPYVNNTLGIDLFRETRPFIYFSADDKLGCLNREYFWVWRSNGGESLYRYREKDRRDYLAEHPQLAREMKVYAESMLQTTQWLIDRQLVK